MDLYTFLCDINPQKSPRVERTENTSRRKDKKEDKPRHNFYLLHPHFVDNPDFEGLLELQSMVKTEEPSQGCPVSVQYAGAEIAGRSWGPLARLIVHFTPALLE